MPFLISVLQELAGKLVKRSSEPGNSVFLLRSQQDVNAVVVTGTANTALTVTPIKDH